MVLIEAKDLCLGYGSKVVVEDLSFVLRRGDYLCVIGENGSGKTTLMRTILGLHKPLSGELHIAEELKSVGYLPQQKEVQKDFPATVKEIVLSGFQAKGFFYTAEEKKIAEEKMEVLGIKDLSDTSYRKLSGGQQQRVLLARALCTSEDFLLLDEPTASLDPEASKLFYELLEKLNNNGVTIMMISHDVDEVLKYATHILQIGDDNFYGEKAQWIERKNHVD